VATWAWPTWVVSRRRVLEAVFVLLEFRSPSRRIFIGSHSLPPLWFAVSVLQKCAGKTCVGLWGYSWGPRELPGVGGPGLGEAGRYSFSWRVSGIFGTWRRNRSWQEKHESYWWSCSSNQSQGWTQSLFLFVCNHTQVLDVLPPSQKEWRFRIQNLSQKNDVLLNLACVHVHVGMQQSIST
jgi:hypothetical protein